jgi:hypothetical protein
VAVWNQEFLRAATGASDTESEEAETTFLKGKDPHHYDVKVVYSYSIPDQKTYVADHVYQFAKNKYVLVKKDDPPSFSRQSNSSTASTDAAPTAPQTGTTPTAFLMRARIEAARRMLEEGKLPAKTIAADSGFKTYDAMRKAFQATLGITPLVYRDRFGATAESSAEA